MKNIFRKKGARILAMVLTLAIMCSLTTIPALANQGDEYHDPAEHWIKGGSRTNELDANAIVTHETFRCVVCEKKTSFLIWRVPEYSRDGQSALTRNVLYSDGTLVGGKGTGVILDGTPGVDAYYTGYHWTKSMCETCGTMGSNDGAGAYELNKNLYKLYDCAAEFMEPLPETVTYENVDNSQHRVTTKGGEYCVFCFGTRHTESSRLENHALTTDVLPQPANGRFAVVEHCTLCDYTRYSYTAAKAVVADYYGVADGQSHTITVTDLSESGVTASIRYGNTADACTMTAAPSYSEAGQYNVYYQITYAYKSMTMTENGVAKVWLRDENQKDSGSGKVTCACGCGDPDCGCNGKDCNGDCEKDKGCGENHNYVLLDTVEPGGLTLGYDRYLCTKCGKIEKRDYTAALGHDYRSIIIREATCETDGKVLEICSRCGDMKETSTPKGEHKYSVHSEAATCTSPGYTVKECSVCGDRHITSMTSALPHNYEPHVTPASCETGGKTVHTCEGCGSSFVTDYTDPLGHSWDEGRVLTRPSCETDGITEYRCDRCGATHLEGAPATGHKESDWIVDREPTVDSEGERHKECEDCGEKLESESIPRLNGQDITDNQGEAQVDGYLVIVTDSDTRYPVMGAMVRLNHDDTLSIHLPDGRLLDYADQTTVTVLLKMDMSAVPGVDIAVTDSNEDYSAGTTDRAGQVTVPGASENTNDNGKATVGGEDENGDRYTLTVKVEDNESGRDIPDAQVSINRAGRISVTLPGGEDMDEQNRIKVTVTDHKRVPQKGLTVVVKSNLGRVEEAETDEKGQVVVPPTAQKVENVRHTAYILGYPDGTYGPDKNMTRSEATAIFARLLAAKRGDTIPATASTGFKDIPDKAWYAGYVDYLSGFGVVTGRTQNTFAPNAPITRAEFTAMSVRFFGVFGDGDAEIMEQYKEFNDVTPGYWAAQYIEDAAKHGWVLGYGDGTFAPPERDYSCRGGHHRQPSPGP